MGGDETNTSLSKKQNVIKKNVIINVNDIKIKYPINFIKCFSLFLIKYFVLFHVILLLKFFLYYNIK